MNDSQFYVDPVKARQKAQTLRNCAKKIQQYVGNNGNFDTVYNKIRNNFDGDLASMNATYNSLKAKFPTYYQAIENMAQGLEEAANYMDRQEKSNVQNTSDTMYS